jgi:serine/threonine protein kinase
MLGDDFVPKVSVFFPTHLMSSSGSGQLEWNDMAYTDPAYLKTCLFRSKSGVYSFGITSKSDVYSFGIVLLELITRKQPRNVDGYFRLRVEYIEACRNENSGKAMFDKEIAVEGNIFILEEMGKLAVECLREDRDKRPEMVEVVERLQKLRRDLKHAEGGLQDATASHADE